VPPTASSRANVSILTFNGPRSRSRPARAPDGVLTGGHVSVVAVGFQTIYDKALLDASTDQRLRRLRVQPQWLGDFTARYLADLTDRVNNDPSWTGGTSAVLPGLQRDLQRQGLHDPARRRLPHGLFPEDILDADGTAAPNLGRLPAVAQKYDGKTSTVTAAGLRLVHREEEGRPELLVDHPVAAGLIQARAPATACSSTRRTWPRCSATTRR
jgi:hypothetical protein